MKTKKIKLSLSQFFSLLNILNEVCHGINVRNFENTIGTERKTVIDFLDRISKKKKEEEIILVLDDFELKFLEKIFEEVLRQIEEWEFQTRIGIAISEANVIKEKIIN